MLKSNFMFRITNISRLFWLPVLLLVIQSSCKKEDKYEAQTLPKVNSIFPISAIIGTEVTLKGVNLKDVTKVRFGTVEAPGFITTDSSVVVDVPAGLSPGDLNVQVYYTGTGYSSVPFTVLETPRPPAISTIDPAKAFPGTTITITGADFATVTQVKLGALNVDFTIAGNTVKFVVPDNAVGGNQLVTVTNPVGSVTVSFNVDLAPQLTSLTPGSAMRLDSVLIKGKRFNNITSVKLGPATAGFVRYTDSTIKFEVPATGVSGSVTVTNSLGTATSANPFGVLGLDQILEPVQNTNLVFFDFNGTGKDRWWGDVGAIENNGSIALAGSGPYFRVNTPAPITNWNGFFWRNGGNNFPGAAIGTNINDYVLKFDIYIIDPITGGEFAWRLKGSSGDFWYYWKPWAANGGTFRTFGWKTFTIPLSEFVDGSNGNHITDLSTIDSDFGVAFNNGTSMVNVAIDNVRFEHR